MHKEIIKILKIIVLVIILVIPEKTLAENNQNDQVEEQSVKMQFNCDPDSIEPGESVKCLIYVDPNFEVSEMYAQIDLESNMTLSETFEKSDDSYKANISNNSIEIVFENGISNKNIGKFVILTTNKVKPDNYFITLKNIRFVDKQNKSELKVANIIGKIEIKESQKNAEELKKEEEQKRLEELQKQEEEQKRQEELQKQEEEQKRQEELQKQEEEQKRLEEFQKQEEEQKRLEELQKQEEEQKRLEANKNPQTGTLSILSLILLMISALSSSYYFYYKKKTNIQLIRNKKDY